MSAKKYKVKLCDRKYIKNINGLKSNFCFGLFNNNNLIGAMIYGQIAMANVWKKYVQKENQLIELRRLCCIDKTLKNTESYFIGYTLRWLKKNTEYVKVISYADTDYNHQGIIYQASNFKFKGMTNKGKVIVYNNKIYHDKTIRTKYKGKLKPYAKKIKEALDNGRAYYKDTLGKKIYIYELKK